MALLWSKKEGGAADVIRCEEDNYLIWKWSPGGVKSKKENAIRYGSRLRVQEGEVAVFAYEMKGNMDYIVGPYDDVIKTKNFPVLSHLAGMAFGGNSPFVAEVYFINLATNIPLPFYIPPFDVFNTPDSDALPIAISVKGKLFFNVTDYKGFIRLNRMKALELDDFSQHIKDILIKEVKGEVANIPENTGIPVIQIEKSIKQVNEIVEQNIKQTLQDTFGINVVRLDIGHIETDKESTNYKFLVEQQTEVAKLRTRRLQEEQISDSIDYRESQRIDREEGQRAQKLHTETSFIGAHALNQQADVLKTAAESMGEMGGSIGGDGGGMNPANMMTGMMMGGAVGGQMANMMNVMGQNMNQHLNQNMNQNINQQVNTPPPPPVIQYMVIVNGQQMGPFSLEHLQQLKNIGNITKDTYVWKQGMPQWETAGNVMELQVLFPENSTVMPPPPPVP